MHPWRFLKIDETHILLIHLPPGARPHTPPPPPSPRPVLLLDSTHSAEAWEVPACFPPASWVILLRQLSTPAISLSFRASCLTPGLLQGLRLFTLTLLRAASLTSESTGLIMLFTCLKPFCLHWLLGESWLPGGLSSPRSGLSCQPHPRYPPATHPVPPCPSPCAPLSHICTQNGSALISPKHTICL